ncbi:conserved hypothetical protein [Sphingomonas sp. T1]|uniref:hypothetical protein n=1 Tax=Sphingomonas sp. T1 TaxID=2653172 RepID=UPI0012F1294B|nr:hypothetical protein [Sphingomonas sp. T1]VXD07338.1 conserved hypothetical protein [Sphingomonas sp. T1]
MNRKTMFGAIVLAIAAPGSARRIPPPATTCIDGERIVSRRAQVPDAIDFTLTGGKTYRSRIGPSCAHLAELDRTYLLVLEEQQGRRICGGDRFRLIDAVAARSGGGGGFPYCRFGPFERVTPSR